MNETSQSPELKTPDDHHKVNKATERPRSGSRALTGLLLLAILTVLHLARDLVLPIVVALILSLVFLPVVRGMKKLRIPAPLGAGIVVLGLLMAFVTGIYNLAEPAGIWLNKAPQSLRELEVKLRHITGSVHDVAKATAQVQDMTQHMTGGGNEKKVPVVAVETPSLAATVLNAVKEFTVTAISMLVLLYFLLACGDLFLRKTLAVTPRMADKQRSIDIAQQVESEVSIYLLTVTLINIGLGASVALAMALLGVPNPVLWGVMAGVLNFIPYLGEIASIGVLAIVGLLTFDDLWISLLVPSAFYMLSLIEGFLITPLIVGRRLSLNPVVIVLSVLFWGWMWGVPGALLAVPILISLKTVCEHVESLKVIGEYLSA